MTGDLKLSMDLRAGELKCHRLVDLVLTASGDLALTETSQETAEQRLAVYFATPKGEMVLPWEGSILYSYLHAPLTPDVLAGLAVDLAADLKLVFPELGNIHVTLRKADQRKIYMNVICSEQAFEYLFSPEDVLELYSKLLQTYEIFRYELERQMGGGVY